jgi:hypothetical protein
MRLTWAPGFLVMAAEDELLEPSERPVLAERDPAECAVVAVLRRDRRLGREVQMPFAPVR